LEHSVNTILDTIWSIFREQGGTDYFGEPVTQMEHAAQSAALAHDLRPDDPEFIIAAFLHDLGHLVAPPDLIGADGESNYGNITHESLGAGYLRLAGFSDKITSLVANHVMAKRYLTATDAAYYDTLSEASKITLSHQGGILPVAEQRPFREDPLFDLHIMLRQIDDKAKVAGQPVSDLGWLESLMRDHLKQSEQ
jgi:predicted HD phosphohydrolase